MTEPTESADASTVLARDLGGEFQILRLLGTGATSEVHLARERALGRLVAIKVLRGEAGGDDVVRQRFQREARAVASLSEHPDIVGIHRFGQLSDGTPYLVMRYVQGRTLEQRLRAEGRLPLEHALQVLRSVASALAAAHAKGIVHRDVRPGNVLWDDEEGKAYLTDFGIAAILETSAMESARLTAVGVTVGDPRYMSPEQLDDRDVTGQADMYGLGLLGYELLTGEGAFDARSKADWIRAHLTQDPRDLTALRPDVPAEVADLLRRCLAKQADHRPRATDVVRILSRPVAPPVPHPAAAAADGEMDLAELIKRRVPQLVALAITAGVTLIGLAGAGVEFYGLPRLGLDLTIVFAVALVLVSLVGSWYHGAAGRQKATPVEWLMYAAIATVWLGVSAVLVLR